MNIGDVIATAEELDALPSGTVVVGRTGAAFTRGCYVSWFDVQAGYFTLSANVVRHGGSPLTILHLPGRRPRPERVVKAEALREYAAAIEDGCRAERVPPDSVRISSSVGEVIASLRGRADLIEAGDLA